MIIVCFEGLLKILEYPGKQPDALAIFYFFHRACSNFLGLPEQSPSSRVAYKKDLSLFFHHTEDWKHQLKVSDDFWEQAFLAPPDFCVYFLVPSPSKDTSH